MDKTKNQEPQPAVVRGHELKCPVCGNRQFRTKRVLLNTTVMTLLDLDWANRNANCYICSNCSHIMWFAE
jgi:predicted nucleic-acid-binding Zn-ribbon protein